MLQEIFAFRVVIITRATKSKKFFLKFTKYPQTKFQGDIM